MSWRGWMKSVRTMLRHRGARSRHAAPSPPELAPVVRDLQVLIRDLEAARVLRDEAQVNWSPEALRNILQPRPARRGVLILSNREPYIHDKRDGKVVVKRPASGLVTALEPVMRACSGTWIAHGWAAPTATRVDRHDHVAVPPDKPAYRLRRIWLSREQEQGYYYGFSNGGLWPLCHIAHVRPRSTPRLRVLRDREPQVRRRRARRGEDARSDRAGAGLPLRARAEARARAPARSDDHHFLAHPVAEPGDLRHLPVAQGILEGMLGSTILGFHTQFHCNNFLDAWTATSRRAWTARPSR
jgi:trehalose 6-phosphate synthase